jgi:hypothetical protein
LGGQGAVAVVPLRSSWLFGEVVVAEEVVVGVEYFPV